MLSWSLAIVGGIAAPLGAIARSTLGVCPDCRKSRNAAERNTGMTKQGAIDIVVNAFTPLGGNKQTGFDANFMAQVRMPEEMRGGVSVGITCEKWRAGIERSLPDIVRAGEPAWQGSFEIPYQQTLPNIVTPIPIDSGWPASTPQRGVEQPKELDLCS